MRPAARLSAAIDILQELQGSDYPARFVLSKWARGNRYAGSKDRAAIANLVFDVLRCRRSYGAFMGDPSPRSLALAAFYDGWGYSLEEVIDLCDGEKYAPAPLDDDEKAGLQRLEAGQLTDVEPAVAADIPDWLWADFTRIFGERALLEGKAMTRRAPIDLRSNSLLSAREEVLQELDPLPVEPLADLSCGLRLQSARGAQKNPLLENLPAYKNGLFEVQDKGSQMVAILTGVKAGMKVLDLCAGAGGKTLAMAAQMDNKGIIYTYDTDAERLRPLAERAKRAGVKIVKPMSASDQDHLISLNGKMDVVLVDAPCTGSGTWRRKPDSKWRLTRDQLEQRLEEQKAVLSQGAKAVRQGGRLIYVTCSVLPAENADQIKAFLAEHEDFSLFPVKQVWREIKDSEAPASAIEDENVLQLTPATNESDGFFIAVLQKQSA